MIEIAFKKELDKVKAMPQEVQEVIKGIVEVLGEEYGEDRSYEEDGGYIIVVEKAEDFQELKEKIYIDCEDAIPEYVDRIECTVGEIYTNVLILCNNDHAISIIELLSQNLKEYMID